MKRVVLMIVLALVSLLLESSFNSLPWILVYIWFWWDTLEIKKVFWLCFVMGVLIDALALRSLGVMSILLLVFVAGAWFLRKIFAGLFLVELIWALVIMSSWSILFFSFQWWILLFGIGVGVLIEIKKRMGLVSEIRLR